MNILRAEAYLARQTPHSTKLSELYDEDDMLRSAVNTLFPNFEYPDFSHLTIGELLKRYQKAPLPLTPTA